MPRIITTTQVQKEIGKVTRNISETAYIATSRGRGKIVMLPYFHGCDERIEDYMEDYEMHKNKSLLQARYAESAASEDSDLMI